MTDPQPNRNATVYVTNVASDHDYSSVPKWGAMRPVTQGNYPIFKTQRLMEEIVEAFSQSQPTDYLAFSGSAFIAALCLAIWLVKHRECNALLYDPKQNSYVPRSIKRSEIVIQLETQQDRLEAAG